MDRVSLFYDTVILLFKQEIRQNNNRNKNNLRLIPIKNN